MVGASKDTLNFTRAKFHILNEDSMILNALCMLIFYTLNEELDTKGDFSIIAYEL